MTRVEIIQRNVRFRLCHKDVRSWPYKQAGTIFQSVFRQTQSDKYLRVSNCGIADSCLRYFLSTLFPLKKKIHSRHTPRDVVGGISSSSVTEQSASRKAPRFPPCAMTYCIDCRFLCNISQVLTIWYVMSNGKLEMTCRSMTLQICNKSTLITHIFAPFFYHCPCALN